MVAILKAPAGEVPTYEVPEGFESAHVAVMAAADVCSSLGHTLKKVNEEDGLSLVETARTLLDTARVWLREAGYAVASNQAG